MGYSNAYQKLLDIMLGKVQMEVEHLHAQVNVKANKFRIQFEGIRESLEPLKNTLLDLDPLFKPPPDSTIPPKKQRKSVHAESIEALHPDLLHQATELLDFNQVKFFSLNDGLEELLSNSLLDSETIEKFRWQFFCGETKMQALKKEIEKIQQRSANPRSKIDEIIQNWLNPPQRILNEYRDLLEEKRILRESLRDEILQNGNLAKQYINNGLNQITSFFLDIEKMMPQWSHQINPAESSGLYPLLSELSLLENEEYLTFWSYYSILQSFKIKPAIEDHWKYFKASQKSHRSVSLFILMNWLEKLLIDYETQHSFICSKLIIYDKLTNEEKIISLE